MSEEREKGEAPYPFFVLTPKSLVHWCAEVVHMEELFRTSNEEVFPDETIRPNALVAHPATWKKMLWVYKNKPHRKVQIRETFMGERYLLIGPSFLSSLAFESTPENEIQLWQLGPAAFQVETQTQVHEHLWRMYNLVFHEEREARHEAEYGEVLDELKSGKRRRIFKRNGEVTRFGLKVAEVYARSWVRYRARLFLAEKTCPEFRQTLDEIRNDPDCARAIAAD